MSREIMPIEFIKASAVRLPSCYGILLTFRTQRHKRQVAHGFMLISLAGVLCSEIISLGILCQALNELVIQLDQLCWRKVGYGRSAQFGYYADNLLCFFLLRFTGSDL